MGIKKELFEKIVSDNFKKIFLVDAVSGKELTYGALFKRAELLAGNLNILGIGKGDKVIIILPNGLDFVVTYFALLIIGAVSVPVNTIYHSRDISYILKTARTKLLVTNSYFADNLKETLKDFPEGHYIIDRQFDPNRISDSGAQRVSFEDNGEDDLMAISYTSGTTAHPKGVMVSYGSIIGNALEYIKALQLDGDAVFYCPLSLAYMAGWYNLLTLPFLAQGKVVVDNTFSATSVFTFWDNIIKHKVNVLWVVPSLMAILLSFKNDKAAEYCRKNIKRGMVGTAPLPVVLKKRFEGEYGITLYENYGLSETLFVTTNSPSIPYKEASVGKPLPGSSITISASDGKPCADGEEGEIIVHSKYLMKGYNGESSAIPAQAKGEVFESGDIGRLDKDGYLFITGRKKDIIIKGGVNISPRAVEEVIYNYEAIDEVAVIGIASDILGEEVIAVIKLKQNHRKSYDEKDLLKYCEKNLAKFQRPSKFIIIDQMPKSSSGKIQKEKLRALLNNIRA